MVYALKEHFILSDRKEQYVLFVKANGRKRE
jgi:hypothetical protein